MKPAAVLTRGRLRQLQAREVVHKHTILAGASMAVPVPGLDLVSELAIQLRMARRLCQMHGAEFDHATARAVITGIVGGIAPSALGPAALRVVSLASWFAGSAPSAALAAAYTYVVGMLLLERLERWGRIDRPPGAVQEHTAGRVAPVLQPALGSL